MVVPLIAKVRFGHDPRSDETRPSTSTGLGARGSVGCRARWCRARWCRRRGAGVGGAGRRWCRRRWCRRGGAGLGGAGLGGAGLGGVRARWRCRARWCRRARGGAGLGGEAPDSAAGPARHLENPCLLGHGDRLVGNHDEPLRAGPLFAAIERTDHTRAACRRATGHADPRLERASGPRAVRHRRHPRSAHRRRRHRHRRGYCRDETCMGRRPAPARGASIRSSTCHGGRSECRSP